MRFLLVLVCAAVAACPAKEEPPAPAAPKPPPTVTEAEPNDEADKAQRLAAPVRVDASWQAGDAPDEDWFQFEAKAPTLLRIEVSGVQDVAPVIEAYDTQGNLRSRVAASKGEAAILPNVHCEGECLFKASSGAKAATGSYRFSAAHVRAAAGLEREPNDRLADAANVAPGDTLQGYVQSTQDEDWFVVEGIAERQTLSARLGSPAEVQLALSVVRVSDGTELGTWRASKPGAGLSVRNVAPPEGEGALALVVKSAAHFSAGDRYTLELSSHPATPEMEVEPNDSPERATPIDPASPQRTGHIAPDGDADWFSFAMEEPAILSATVSGVEGVDVELSVLKPEKHDEVLARANDGKEGEGEALVGVALPAGEHRVRVTGTGEGSDAPYSLQLELAPDDGTTEHEPNQTADQASYVKLGREHRGWIHPAGDVDLWRLGLLEPANVTLTLSAVPGLDLSILVRDASRPTNDPSGIVGRVDRARVEGAERLVVPFEAGNWLIEIREKGKASNPTRPYVLTVR